MYSSHHMCELIIPASGTALDEAWDLQSCSSFHIESSES